MQAVTVGDISYLPCREAVVDENISYVRGYFKLLEGKGRLVFSQGNKVLKTFTPSEELFYFELPIESNGRPIRVLLTEESGSATKVKLQYYLQES